MEAKETNFLKFLISPKQLVIPIYQRTYSWKLKECAQLWKDIVRVGSDETIPGHFVGSIVYVERGLYQVSGLPRLLVIDGQQRLTTLSLIIAALCNHIRENEIKTDINPEKLTDYYLLNDKETGEEKYKLVLTQSDKSTLFKILDRAPLTAEEQNRVKENYDFFKEQIANVDLNIVHKGISKLIIIDVSLDREKDNPQLIFESLNSTGLELTQADLIRNYILMGLEKAQQEEIYRDYWYPMEKGFGHSENTELFDKFMRDYLTIKIGRIPTIREIYSEFKQYYAKSDNVKEKVNDIFEFSKYFVNIALEKEPDEQIKDAFVDINQLKVDVSYPFILSVYRDYSKKKINKEEFIEILRLIESYVFRRAVCEVPTNSLNKTFATLYKEVDQENYLKSIMARFILQTSYRRLPGNEEFKEALFNKGIYYFRNRNYLLRKLENYGRKELVDVEAYTIEHVLPQNPNLSAEWKAELGENWEEVQRKWLHTIGNLTLTGYNSELSDSPFKTKRDMQGGFRDSPIRLNRSLAGLENWNEEQIKIRANGLVELAIDVWKYPLVDSETLSKYRAVETEESKHKYTIEDHKYLSEDSPMRPLFDELRKRILNIDSSVSEEPQKLYVAYKSLTNFVDIVPQKKALRLSLNISFDKIKDPKEKCRDISGLGKWGNGDTEVKIDSNEDLEYVLNLIKQAFDNVSELGDNS